MSNSATDYNNVGICSCGIMAVFRHVDSLPSSKVLLIMPLIMHEGTMRYLGDGRTAPKGIAALIANRPELFVNFPARFSASLATSLNAIQLLVNRQFLRLDGELQLRYELNVDRAFGTRATKIESASKNIAAMLSGPADELYLNLRIPL